MDLMLNKGGKADPVKETSTAGFKADVIDASMKVPVVVDFWAPWCGPCKQLGPLLEKAVRETGGAVRMVKLNIDQNQALAQQMRIQSIPAVYAFFQGRPIDGFVGSLPESQVKAFIDRLKKAATMAGAQEPEGDPFADALEAAKDAFGQGDLDTAAEIYTEILAHKPKEVIAIAGLARIQLARGQVAAAKAALAKTPKELESHAEIVALKSQVELAEQAAKAAGALGELQARMARDPNDHQARYDVATALFAQGRREEAIEQLLDLFKRDRKWNEEAARKQLVKFFEAMGFDDALSVQGRRRLSALMFA
jgi:putative thioredoxin